MNVFSTIPSPFVIPFDYDNGVKRGYVTIRAGRNQVPDDVWAKVQPRIQRKMDAGFIRASEDLSADLNKKEKAEMLQQPSPAYVDMLCAKSAPIETGKQADGSFEIVGG